VSAAPVVRWLEVSRHNWLGDFYRFRVVFERSLDDLELQRAAGCIGYALRQVLAGESLDNFRVVARGSKTVVEVEFDSTKSQRDDPDYLEAFELAALYVREGTPIRKTNRAGSGTQGTRLVEGVGCRVVFQVEV
jgi:hypothetical protein